MFPTYPLICCHQILELFSNLFSSHCLFQDLQTRAITGESAESEGVYHLRPTFVATKVLNVGFVSDFGKLKNRYVSVKCRYIGIISMEIQ